MGATHTVTGMPNCYSVSLDLSRRESYRGDLGGWNTVCSRRRMYRFSWIVSKVVSRIDKFNRGMVGGIEKSKFSDASDSSQGFHISTGNPSICIPTHKHKKKIRAAHVRLAKPRKIINVIFKTQK
jgi:hypothetical protein